MKKSGILILAGFVACTIALVWQAREIQELRAEAGALRRDLLISLDQQLESPGDVTSEANQVRRENLELIRLRHEVRELQESVVESHARERMANVKAIVGSVIPTAALNQPWNFRPEWEGMEALATNQYAQAIAALNSATNDFTRFLHLARAAKMSLAVGRTEDARRFATDLLVLDEKYSRGDPQKASGDAVFHGHTVLGQIALDNGRVDEAKRHLRAAGKSNGSPVLSSFGPSMSLAKGLLDNGEQQSVLEYLESCRTFWRLENGRLDEWIQDIRAGRIPDFKGNLL